jgi:regulator of sigma E protease
MNWLLAFVLFTLVFSVGTTIILDELPESAIVRDRSVQITQILPNSPADKAGLVPGDRVISVAGKDIATFEEGRKLIADQGEAEFGIRVERDGEIKDINASPKYIDQIQRVGIGVGLADVGLVSFTPFQAVKVAALTTYGYTKAILFTFADLLKNLILLRPLSQEVSGPVGIAVMTGKIARQGIMPLLQFAAILSINLAILNFLPIPALDGGRVLFLAIEKLRRRAMSRAVESAIHNVAFLLLLCLILFVTVRDISTYGGDIVGGIKGLVGL